MTPPEKIAEILGPYLTTLPTHIVGQLTNLASELEATKQKLWAMTDKYLDLL
jgi:hypothetical protein